MDSSQNELGVRTELAASAGILVPCTITFELSDILEVPEEWQFIHSYDDRVKSVLIQYREEAAKWQSGVNPIRFSARVMSYFRQSDIDLDLLGSFDGEVLTIGLFDPASI